MGAVRALQAPGGDADGQRLFVWPVRVGTYVPHSRHAHPRTPRGKDERFHGTLEPELLSRHQSRDAVRLQAGADQWRDEHNRLRPHEALGLRVVANRWRPGRRSLPKALVSIECPAGTPVHRV